MKTIMNLRFQVAAVWNGKEALEYLLQPSNPRPDVILMDVSVQKIVSTVSSNMLTISSAKCRFWMGIERHT
jgi:CheY-like chemotaxis protein